jgi:hypothetical protein
MRCNKFKRRLAGVILAAALCFGAAIPGVAAEPEVISSITVSIPEAPGLTATFKNVYADYFAPANVPFSAQSADVLNGQYLFYFDDAGMVSFNQDVMLTYASSEGFDENNNPTLYAGNEIPIGFKLHAVDGKVVQSLSEAQSINWDIKRGENAVKDFNLYAYYNSAAQSPDFSFDLREGTWGTPRMSLYNIAAVTPQQQTPIAPAAPMPADGAFVVSDYDMPSYEQNNYEVTGETPDDGGGDIAPPVNQEESIAPFEETAAPQSMVEEPGAYDISGWETFVRTDYTVAVSDLINETAVTVDSVGSFMGLTDVPVYWLPLSGADTVFARTDGAPLFNGDAGVNRRFYFYTLGADGVYYQDGFVEGLWDRIGNGAYGERFDAVAYASAEIYAVSPDGLSLFFFGYIDETPAPPAAPVNPVTPDVPVLASPSVPLPPPSVTALYGDSVLAPPTASTVYVNGAGTFFDAYNINGNNYFKLRDLAVILSGTIKQFEVGWDIETSAITLTSGLPYTPVGGEMSAGGSNSKVATPTGSKIYIDGVPVNLTVYFIEGNNYFKLRDIGRALNFGVIWDAGSGAVVIDTSLGYTP